MDGGQDLLYEDEEVAELVKAELDGSSGDDGVDVLNHSGGLTSLHTNHHSSTCCTCINKL